MKTKTARRWSELRTDELARATRAFDRADTEPAKKKAPKAQRDRMLRAMTKVHRHRVAVALDADLVQAVDALASSTGVAFSDVISDAVRQHLSRRAS